MNHSGVSQDTPPTTPWTVGGRAPTDPWHKLPPGGACPLCDRPGAGRCDRLELTVRSLRNPADLSRLFLQWESSPAPEMNEAGVRARAIDGRVPLQALVPLATASDDGTTFHLPITWSMPYSGGLRISLVATDLTAAVECRYLLHGQDSAPPADRRYLRAGCFDWPPAGLSTAVYAPAADQEHTLFETHGCGRLLALIANGATDPAVHPWNLSWYLDGDERLQQIEEHPAAGWVYHGNAEAAERLPAFAEYLKCTLRWVGPPPVAAGSIVVVARVEDRPIA